MKTSFAILALLGLVATDVDALSLERRHHRHVPGVTFVMDAGMDGEDKKIAEAIAKDKADEAKAELVAAQKEQLEKLKNEIEEEKRPQKLNEEEEKAVLDTSVKKLEQSALAGDAEDLIKKADRKLRKAAEEKLPVDPEVVAEKAE
jgi:metal-dependent hydrolase (beta-lactamase superfamily II)